MIIAIVGGTGGIGDLFRNEFVSAGHEVLIVGRKNYDALGECVRKSNVIILSVPLDVVAGSLRDVSMHVSPDKLVVDFSSGMIADLGSVNCFSAFMHPLFAPSVKTVRGGSIVYVPVRRGKVLDEFIDLLRSLGARIIESSVKEHEKVMAVVQALAHFSNILFAKTVADSGVPASRLKDFMTAFFRLNIDSVSRIFSQKPELYANIQFSSKDFPLLLEKFKGNFDLMLDALERKDVSVYEGIFAVVNKELKELLEPSFEESKELLSVVLSRKPKLGVLGPAGSFSDAAADFVGDYEKLFLDEITSVIKAVKSGIVSKGIIPIENSLEGTVVASLDGINDYGLFVEEAVVLPIHQCVAGLSVKVKPELVLSHPQALAQCKGYLEKHYPNAKLVKTLSTSEAFRKISDERLTNAVAIGSLKSASIYGLEVIASNVEDEGNNKTKFFVVSNEESINPKAVKTFIVVYPESEVQGILYRMLGFFNSERINLSKIESRPSRKKLGNYLFYIEFDGNVNDAKVKRALNNIRRGIGGVKVLGCYTQREVN